MQSCEKELWRLWGVAEKVVAFICRGAAFQTGAAGEGRMKLEAPQKSASPPCPLALSLNLPCAFAPSAVAFAAEHPLMSPQALGIVTDAPSPLDTLAARSLIRRYTGL